MKKIRIGPIEYNLLFIDKSGLQNDEAAAEINYEKQAIFVKNNNGKAFESVCILHEVLHGILYQLSENKINDNEAFVDRLAHSLLAFLKDNTELVAELINRCKDE